MGPVEIAREMFLDLARRATGRAEESEEIRALHSEERIATAQADLWLARAAYFDQMYGEATRTLTGELIEIDPDTVHTHASLLELCRETRAAGDHFRVLAHQRRSRIDTALARRGPR